MASAGSVRVPRADASSGKPDEPIGTQNGVNVPLTWEEELAEDEPLVPTHRKPQRAPSPPLDNLVPDSASETSGATHSTFPSHNTNAHSNVPHAPPSTNALFPPSPGPTRSSHDSARTAREINNLSETAIPIGVATGERKSAEVDLMRRDWTWGPRGKLRIVNQENTMQEEGEKTPIDASYPRPMSSQSSGHSPSTISSYYARPTSVYREYLSDTPTPSITTTQTLRDISPLPAIPPPDALQPRGTVAGVYYPPRPRPKVVDIRQPSKGAKSNVVLRAKSRMRRVLLGGSKKKKEGQKVTGKNRMSVASSDQSGKVEFVSPSASSSPRETREQELQKRPTEQPQQQALQQAQIPNMSPNYTTSPHPHDPAFRMWTVRHQPSSGAPLLVVKSPLLGETLSKELGLESFNSTQSEGPEHIPSKYVPPPSEQELIVKTRIYNPPQHGHLPDVKDNRPRSMAGAQSGAQSEPVRVLTHLVPLENGSRWSLPARKESLLDEEENANVGHTPTTGVKYTPIQIDTRRFTRESMISSTSQTDTGNTAEPLHRLSGGRIGMYALVASPTPMSPSQSGPQVVDAPLVASQTAMFPWRERPPQPNARPIRTHGMGAVSAASMVESERLVAGETSSQGDILPCTDADATAHLPSGLWQLQRPVAADALTRRDERGLEDKRFEPAETSLPLTSSDTLAGSEAPVTPVASEIRNSTVPSPTTYPANTTDGLTYPDEQRSEEEEEDAEGFERTGTVSPSIAGALAGEVSPVFMRTLTWAPRLPLRVVNSKEPLDEGGTEEREEPVLSDIPMWPAPPTLDSSPPESEQFEFTAQPTDAATTKEAVSASRSSVARFKSRVRRVMHRHGGRRKPPTSSARRFTSSGMAGVRATGSVKRSNQVGGEQPEQMAMLPPRTVSMVLAPEEDGMPPESEGSSPSLCGMSRHNLPSPPPPPVRVDSMVSEQDALGPAVGGLDVPEHGAPGIVNEAATNLPVRLESMVSEQDDLVPAIRGPDVPEHGPPGIVNEGVPSTPVRADPDSDRAEEKVSMPCDAEIQDHVMKYHEELKESLERRLQIQLPERLDSRVAESSSTPGGPSSLNQVASSPPHSRRDAPASPSTPRPNPSQDIPDRPSFDSFNSGSTATVVNVSITPRRAASPEQMHEKHVPDAHMPEPDTSQSTGAVKATTEEEWKAAQADLLERIAKHLGRASISTPTGSPESERSRVLVARPMSFVSQPATWVYTTNDHMLDDLSRMASASSAPSQPQHTWSYSSSGSLYGGFEPLANYVPESAYGEVTPSSASVEYPPRAESVGQGSGMPMQAPQHPWPNVPPVYGGRVGSVTGSVTGSTASGDTFGCTHSDGGEAPNDVAWPLRTASSVDMSQEVRPASGVEYSADAIPVMSQQPARPLRHRPPTPAWPKPETSVQASVSSRSSVTGEMAEHPPQRSASPWSFVSGASAYLTRSEPQEHMAPLGPYSQDPYRDMTSLPHVPPVPLPSVNTHPWLDQSIPPARFNPPRPWSLPPNQTDKNMAIPPRHSIHSGFKVLGVQHVAGVSGVDDAAITGAPSKKGKENKGRWSRVVEIVKGR
ncbi:uncharacterized protein SPPG_01971 [Spizellomyces punctatus DAOM BR117]|uniref:Uncharacterized protein n=1 Tax=Spizellomyces punctatus (strain DAOM BR117) TaxID=645134 RepID=A0A0L0HN94_SPIPD|nr:uncharacterized protein SPPG_01971 [Spizellomyces punctatus DAOM BR117]KND02891.1 hypothetical protein SPPG_01971 [Spizellomyces punctatus DAOM BR117]|eukprot:XP_016610930.1 hypothetical protein SPPG_01971 [Spizellomyces punctatus DAOM BR117]